MRVSRMIVMWWYPFSHDCDLLPRLQTSRDADFYELGHVYFLFAYGEMFWNDKHRFNYQSCGQEPGVSKMPSSVKYKYHYLSTLHFSLITRLSCHSPTSHSLHTVDLSLRVDTTFNTAHNKFSDVRRFILRVPVLLCVLYPLISPSTSL